LTLNILNHRQIGHGTGSQNEMDRRLIGMTVDLVIRGTGSIRSPSEHLALLGAEGAGVILYGQEAPEAGVFGAVNTPEGLRRAVETADTDRLLVYGEELVLTLAQHLSLDTVWVTLGRSANAVREVWRLRGNHPWLGTLRLVLLLEDQEMAAQVDRSTLLATGRVAQVITMPVRPSERVLAEVAVASFGEPVAPAPDNLTHELYEPEAAVETAPVEEMVPDPIAVPVESSQSGGTDAMADERRAPGKTPVIEHERETEQALLSRYTLVRKRRNLQHRLPQVEEVIQSQLREIFLIRFTTSAEAATAFEELSRKLSHTAAEFRELMREKERVEHELDKLSWLKGELEM
jgi:hypothetical protein